jgi:hypothetical protein
MFVMFSWEGHGNVTEMSYMMGEIIVIPLKRMVVDICCCHWMIRELKRKLH